MPEKRRRGFRRLAFLKEVVQMAGDSILGNKMRSGLTVLGIVIGITAMVGMSSLILGFDRSLRRLLEEIGPNTIYVVKFSGVSFMTGADFLAMVRRPNLSVEDADAIRRQVPEARWVDAWLGGGSVRMQVISYGGEQTQPVMIMGVSDVFSEVSFAPLDHGRFFTASEVRHASPVVVLGQGPFQWLFPATDPVGKTVRVGGERYRVVGVLSKRPSPAGFDTGLDDFAVIPHTKFAARYGLKAPQITLWEHHDVTLVVIPRPDATRDETMRGIEQVLRVRHGLRVDEPNDFDMVTQDSAIRIWEQLTRATFLALIVLSSIALVVGGIGVMAVMLIAVKERTREIGLRKALGARRQEILVQFLIEAGILTSIGGVAGMAVGALVALAVHVFADFPIALPWWSVSLGLGCSTLVGLTFGTVPAMKAARIDPIEALHHQ